MTPEAILFPVIFLVLLTFGIALWMGWLRFEAVRRGDLAPRYYELNRGGKPPDYLAKVANNYNNLLELPMLFYLLAVLLYVTRQVDWAQWFLAWLFVASRYVHSYIHTNSNHVPHRMRAFIAGSAILITMWLIFIARFTQSYFG